MRNGTVELYRTYDEALARLTAFGAMFREDKSTELEFVFYLVSTSTWAKVVGTRRGFRITYTDECPACAR